jgi:hypothetical protein
VDVRTLSSVNVSNVLSEEKKQQAIALGRLGWSLRRIQRETGIRRETISAYLKEAGVALRLPRGRLVPAKPANEVTPDSQTAKPASRADEVPPDSGAEAAAPAVTALESQPRRSPSASACEAPPGNHRVGTVEGPQRQGHLAGLGR